MAIIQKPLTLYCPGGFISGNKEYRACALSIVYKSKKIFLNGQPLANAVTYITPAKGVCWINGMHYEGIVRLQCHKTQAWISVWEKGTNCTALVLRQKKVPEKKDVNQAVQEKKNKLYHVRVLLAQTKHVDGSGTWKIASPAGFNVIDVQEKEPKKDMIGISLFCAKTGNFILIMNSMSQIK